MTDDDQDTCERCGAAFILHVNDSVECDCCGAEGCQECMKLVCPDCDWELD